MKNNKCLYCYQLLEDGENYHPECSKEIFGTSKPPLLPYTNEQMGELAWQIIQSKITITGVQPKVTLDLENNDIKDTPKRFTIVGLWGHYILKPPTEHYPFLPEVEDLTMHLASIAKINVVPHSLIRLQSGELAYITKRVDRIKKKKLHMEDMCQLTDRLTENKYDGSYEQIGKAIWCYSDNPGLDIVNFAEQVIFSFLTGNADMHLKNFSLIDLPAMGYNLAPAYDLVATTLVNPADKEETALTLNGKKRKLTRRDFETLFTKLKLDKRQQDNVFVKFDKVIDAWRAFIKISFIPEKMKKTYIELITHRIKLLLPSVTRLGH